MEKEFEGKVSRNGKFEIGVLAAFLLGNKIKVSTKSKNECQFGFEATLETNFIEIKKEKTTLNSETGTEIIISLTENTNSYFQKEEYTDIAWYDWFLYDIPKVEYYLNKGLISKNKSFYEQTGKKKLKYSEGITVEWFPDNFLCEDSNSIYVSCNGIFINKYEKKVFSCFIRKKQEDK